MPSFTPLMLAEMNPTKFTKHEFHSAGCSADTGREGRVCAFHKLPFIQGHPLARPPLFTLAHMKSYSLKLSVVIADF